MNGVYTSQRNGNNVVITIKCFNEGVTRGAGFVYPSEAPEFTP